MKTLYGDRSATIVLISVVWSVSGCVQQLEHQSWVNPTAVAADEPQKLLSKDRRKPDFINESAIDLNTFHFIGKSGNNQHNLAYSLAAGSDDEARKYRNRLTEILLNRSDTICTVEMGKLTAHEAMANLSLDTLSSAFSTVGTIVTGGLAHGALSGAAGFSTAVKSHLSADVYRNAISATITHAVYRERALERQDIEGKFNIGTSDYSVDQMIAEMNRYHATCSVFVAFQLLNDSIDQKKAATLSPAAIGRSATTATTNHIETTTTTSSSTIVPDASAQPVADTVDAPTAETAPRAVAAATTPSTRRPVVTARWGTIQGRGEWTATALREVELSGKALWTEGFIPADINDFCPGYASQKVNGRQAFWVGLLSSMAAHETSDYDPRSVTLERDNKTISIGLLQLSVPDQKICGPLTTESLKDPILNLRCGVRILARYVEKDKVVSQGHDKATARGAARYWGPMRTGIKKADIAGWTARQPYCKVA